MKLFGKRGKGEEVKRKFKAQALSPLPFSHSPSARGWTLIELVITLTVLSILTIGVIPLVRTSIRRQKELQLREALREMRGAIDAFKRDTAGMQCGPGGAIVPPNGQNGQQQGQQVYVDPRSH